MQGPNLGAYLGGQSRIFFASSHPFPGPGCPPSPSRHFSPGPWEQDLTWEGLDNLALMSASPSIHEPLHSFIFFFHPFIYLSAPICFRSNLPGRSSLGPWALLSGTDSLAFLNCVDLFSSAKLGL